MNMFQKIIYITSLLASMIFASPAPAAPKVEITPQDWPELCYTTRAKQIVCKEDMSFGVATYEVTEYSLSRMGWANMMYTIKLNWDNNTYINYEIKEKKAKGGYDIINISQEAAKKHPTNYDSAFRLFEAGIKAHEAQHIRDLTVYNMLNFIGFNNLKADTTALKKRAAEIADRMEARAMYAELQGMKSAAEKKISEIKKEIKHIISKNKETQKLIDKYLDHIKEVHKQAGQKKNHKKILSSAELSSLHSSLGDINKILIDYLEEINHYTELIQNAETMMLDNYSKSKIAISGTLYTEAYNKYIKTPSLKEDNMLTEKNFKALILTQEEILTDYFKACVTELIAKGKSDFEYTVTLPKKANPVCRPCMVGDTMGTCKRPWCKNRNNKHSRYVREKGDYIPMNYDTLEPPKNWGNKYLEEKLIDPTLELQAGKNQ